MIELGWVQVAQGLGEAGLAQMHQGLEALMALKAEIYLPAYAYLLADAYGKVGQHNMALRRVTEARKATEASGMHYMAAEVLRLEGELLLQSGNADVARAERCLQQALKIARRQHAKSWELRTAITLARSWQRADKRQEARKLLEPVYGWFTEGFDTADLKEAKALLDG